MNLYGVELETAGDMVCEAARNGAFEPDSMAAWLMACKRVGAVALDVGAYTGLYAIAARQQGAEIYAFEPNERNYERLARNIGANHGKGFISVSLAAVGDHMGAGEMHDLHGRPMLTSAGKVRPAEGGPVHMLTIDSLMLHRCDVIKADVEGGELAVLRGAARTIGACLPLLILEANTEQEREALDRELSQYGYRPGTRVDVRNLLYVHPDR